MINVVPVFRIVPNGVVKGDKDNRLRVTVLATPVVQSGPGELSLEQWPSRIAAWFEKSDYTLDLTLEPAEAGGAVRPACTGEGCRVRADLIPLRRAHGKKHAKQWDGIVKLWQAAIQHAGTFDLLAQALIHSNGNQAFHVQMETPLPVGDELEKAVEHGVGDDGSIKETGSGQGTTETVATVLSISHADFAELLQTKRGERVCRALADTHIPMVRGDAMKTKQVERKFQNPSESAVMDKDKQKLLVRELLKKRLAAAMNGTAKARSEASVQFERIRTELESTACVVPPENPQFPLKPTETELVAAQQYGSAPQNGSLTGSPDERDAVAQAFYALQTSPTLSRVFGLAFDAEIVINKAAELPNAPDSGFAYAFVCPDVDTCKQSKGATAVRIRFEQGKAKEFLPATRAEMILSSDCDEKLRNRWLDGRDQRDGLVPMGASLANAQRFQLTSLDVRRAIDQSLDADKTDTTGEKVRALCDAGQRYSTVGFAFNDRRRSIGVMEELAVVEQHRTDPARAGTLYAEDLAVGHVIDVRVEEQRSDGKPGKTSAWRCLMERHVEFGRLEEFDEVVPELVGRRRSARRMDLERDLVAAATRVLPNPALYPQAQAGTAAPPEASSPPAKRFVDLIVEEAVAIWTGAPRGVDTGATASRVPQRAMSGMENKACSSQPKPPIVRTLGLPGPRDAGRERRPPPLRYGVAYRFAMRCVYAGGGGLTLDEAGAVIQKEPKRPYLLPVHGPRTCRRNESILRPDVLMLADDARRGHGVMGFENSLDVVLRSPNGTLQADKIFFAKDVKETNPYPLGTRTMPTRSTRIIMPPVVGMEDAARHGMFDGAGGDDNWRRGAMPMLDYRGGYSKCREVTESGWNADDVLVTREMPSFDTGHGVAIFKLRPARDEVPVRERFFPDPAARALVIRVLRNGSKNYLPDEAAIIPFYTRGSKDAPLQSKDYSSVRPIRLNFEIAAPSADMCIFDQGSVPLRDNGLSVQAASVVIKLAASDDLHVHMWCIPDEGTLESQFALVEYMTSCGEKSAAAKLLRHVRKNGPVPELAAVESITATHAINRPAADPIIRMRSDVVDRLPPAQVTPPSPPAPGTPAVETPPEHTGFLLDGTMTLDTASTDTFEIYITCAAPSDEMDNINLERSLSKRRAGMWPKYPDPRTGEEKYLNARELFGFDVADNFRVTLPKSTVLLARGDQLPPPEDGTSTSELELAEILRAGLKQAAEENAETSGDKKLRKVASPFVFRDEKARRLQIRVVAIGRHASKFQIPATFAAEAGRRQQRRSIPLNPSEQCRVGEADKLIWLNAAMRPLVPVLNSCEPSFSVRRLHPIGTTMTLVTCQPNVRIRMPRPWFSSGEDELLGVVVALDEDKLSPSPVPPDRVVSRWGSDPIWQKMPGELHLRGTRNFDLERCRHRHRVIPKYDLPVGPPNEPTKRTQRTTLILFEPHFDVDRQEWYVDVPLRESVSATPFVQFVLVRYQEHTSSRFPKTSEPVTTQAQVMPKREIEAYCLDRGGDWHVSVTMRGLANQGPYVSPRLAIPELVRPRLSLRLYHEDVNPKSSSKDRRHRVDVITDIERRLRLEEGEPWYQIESGQMEWRLETTIDKARRESLGPGNYVAYLTETQRFMPATYAEEPVTWDDMNREETLVTTGARFSLRIDLRTPTIV
ncbi:hypothetical protein J2848_007002 [Azospirillum lipoferum]|uniref:Uncharacterized protein n=1 Tax=Azospirillum lipoferum TaxID=193 RepID=A0A5A9G3W8_AZOLI|nr:MULTISPECIES: hypothetical protein [Azospirillum]KAA0588404.1 hypothetical protein FZ942_33185 [Azospirillum lipoferum]MCP1615289.1 hypothetical protein [Azospirillum lipoferum]MDW5534025.1 hypothetical protein [Azospirillum sp. NL1]